jgi:threonine synthase
MRKVIGLQCIRCGKEHKLKETKYKCLSCEGNLQVVYDYNLIRKRLTYKALDENHNRDIWRYIDILPVEDIDNVPSVSVGWTPLYDAKKLAEKLEIADLYIKDESRNPTSSLKDRTSAIVLSRALDLEESVITTASTGNAAASLACMAGSFDLKTMILAPKNIPEPKTSQILVFGANVIMIDGSYNDAFNLSLEASEEYGWYNCSTGYNPFTREGQKTCAFEICEQLDWETPTKVIVPIGDGNLISGLWKGFNDFQKLGIIEKLPSLIGVQVEGNDSIKKAFESGEELEPITAPTIADSISVEHPRDAMAALQALTESKGAVVSVNDEEIIKAIPEIARGANVFAEPSAAAAYAGLKKAISSKLISDSDSVACIITGSGLKDIASARKAVENPYFIKPTVADLKALVTDKKLI